MRPEEEPPAFNLTEVDRQVLAQTDEEFILHDWEDLKSIIARNDLGILKRKPSDLLRYLAWSKETKLKYGTITNYICKQRLGWPLPTPFKNPTPFADPSDYKILRNDWPYGMSPGITHLVVWLRTPVAVKEENGDVTDESRALIEGFVQRTFVARIADADGDGDAGDRVLWFKNWTALQSVRSLEHVHVLVRDVPEELLWEWTGEGPPRH
ncbi:hypothetical protein BO70DRAFT_365091 [Aspergillus heteromorphus CBS 117.55]|uniref:N-acetylglucosamine-induced protein 1 n=1 Tax=Aspergillus heteromorphus CBS 117.55 TaxID=1448321 RepID=A0A317VIM3_9EURO|nr:uncharacterized protein BO70DRAFT_365091 [Aspergillus heteromorphus CBS 117.55]PWY71690.1 hypothetical protein BO70DRAFT_365091 [Aspergillus heteromorphus CBS 117.55]